MARMNVRQMWAAKLAGKPMPAALAAPKNAGLTAQQSLALKPRAAFAGRVLGIDPSLRGTGLALIEFAAGRQPVLLRCQTVKVPAKHPMAYALGEIHRAVAAFIDGADVKHVALEQTIFVQNFQTAQILGAARGASKEQMARTVMALLGHGRTLALDEADAAGVALCHAFTWRE